MTKLGKYEVLAELAKGSMGILYRARDTVLDREVALKTIAGTGSLDPGGGVPGTVIGAPNHPLVE